MNKISTLTFALVALGTTQAIALDLKNETKEEAHCHVAAFDGHAHTRCVPESVEIKPNETHKFTISNTNGFNADNCSSAPKPEGMKGFNAWVLACDGAVNEVGLHEPGEKGYGTSFDVTQARKVVEKHDELLIE